MTTRLAVLGDKPYASVVLKDTNVMVQRLVAPLVRFLARAGDVHMTLFAAPLVITSGNDGNHLSGSAHLRNSAVDLRSRDISDVQQVVFQAVLVELGREDKIGVFDERLKPGEGHWHCEVLA